MSQKFFPLSQVSPRHDLKNVRLESVRVTFFLLKSKILEKFWMLIFFSKYSVQSHLQLLSHVKSKLSKKSIICSFFLLDYVNKLLTFINIFIIYLVILGRLCYVMQYL